jgi:hypothetical protein
LYAIRISLNSLELQIPPLLPEDVHLESKHSNEEEARVEASETSEDAGFPLISRVEKGVIAASESGKMKLRPTLARF